MGYAISSAGIGGRGGTRGVWAGDFEREKEKGGERRHLGRGGVSYGGGGAGCILAEMSKNEGTSLELICGKVKLTIG